MAVSAQGLSYSTNIVLGYNLLLEMLESPRCRSTCRLRSAPITAMGALKRLLSRTFAALGASACAALTVPGFASVPVELAPTALSCAPGGDIYIACAGANEVRVYAPATGRVVRHLALPGSPSGMALSADGAKLFVTCAAPQSRVCLLDTASGQVAAAWLAGHTSSSPVLSRDEKLLFVCNRFNDDVALFELPSGKELCRIPVAREPVSAALTADGRPPTHGSPAHFRP